MSKPIIGVMPLWDDEKNSMWMLPGYFEGISQAGGVPIMLPLSVDKDGLDQLIEMCDGFLFSGGHDVSPEIYNEKPLDNLVSSCIRRDEMEAYILKKAIEIDKPIFGICRGIQFINAALGGSLYQDLPTQHKSEVEHHQTPPYDISVHKVKIVKDSPLYKCLNTELLEVNSYHHQAVREVAPVLKTMALSEDGLIEALYKPDNKFLWAVQWHPEFSYKTDEKSRMIFKKFVDASTL
ncbi:MAG: gamma-glutamyl-gamma-aminobutyrate hydrolase family protein [Paludibacteraceae bacterium]|nr:gamma-glutamyl-gamma-aminobutyrate hydrolase family protein [Paludibacteraceae bacterium]